MGFTILATGPLVRMRDPLTAVGDSQVRHGAARYAEGGEEGMSAAEEHLNGDIFWLWNFLMPWAFGARSLQPLQESFRVFAVFELSLDDFFSFQSPFKVHCSCHSRWAGWSYSSEDLYIAVHCCTYALLHHLNLPSECLVKQAFSPFWNFWIQHQQHIEKCPNCWWCTKNPANHGI